jgi:hypothetical protein
VALSELEKRGKLPKGEALQEQLAAAEAVVKQSFCELPNLDVIIPALLEHGLSQLHERAQLTAGIPVKPMLAKPTKGISEVLDRFSSGRFTCEYKYDGERTQIHMLEGGEVKVRRPPRPRSPAPAAHRPIPPPTTPAPRAPGLLAQLRGDHIQVPGHRADAAARDGARRHLVHPRRRGGGL